MKMDFLSVLDLQEDIDDVLAQAAKLKNHNEKSGQQLKGQTLAMIFEKSSTRTRVSFEVGIMQLGGNTIYLSQKDSQLGRGRPSPIPPTSSAAMLMVSFIGPSVMPIWSSWPRTRRCR